MGGNPLIDQYLKNLAAVQQFRINNTHAGRLDSFSAGSPTALQLALEAMRARSPIGTYTPAQKEDSGFKFSSLFKVPADQEWLPDWMKKAYTVSQIINPAALAGRATTEGIAKAAEVGPIKWGIEQLSRPMYGVGSMIEDTNKKADEMGRSRWIGPDVDPKALATSFLEGITLKNKVTPGEALLGKPEGPAEGWGDVGKGAARFGLDVALDPLSYIGVGAATKAGKVSKTGKATEIIQGIPKKEPLAIERHSVSTPRFTAGTTGIADRFNPIQLADEITASSLTKTVATTPKLAHPGLNVDPIFKDVTTESIVRTPKTVTETVEIPSFLTEEPKVSKSLAQRRAVKMAMLQSPGYKVQGQYTINDLLKTAAEHPERQADIERIINAEVNRVFKERKVNTVLPSSKTGQQLIPFTGREGTGKAAFGLTLEQATKLFSEGKIGGTLGGYGSKEAQDFLSALPFHDPSDFNIATLKNAKGATVTLKQYLDDLGVDVTAVTPTGEPKSILSHSVDDSAFASMVVPKAKTKTVTKTIYEEVKKTTAKTQRLSQAESIAWALKHQGVLSKDEISYLRISKNREEFFARVKELSTKQIAGDFKTLQAVVDAHKAGLIPAEAFQKILDIAGAKNATELLKKADKILNGIKGKSKVTSAPKVERIKGKAPDTVWEGVKSVDQVISDVSKGDTSLVQPAAPVVTQQLVTDLTNAIPEAVQKNLARVLDPKGEYKWETTIKKAKRTSPVAGQGYGRNLHGWNMYSQSDVFRALTTGASKRLYGVTRGKTGSALHAALRVRPAMMYTQVMSAMRAAEFALKKQGVKIVAGSDNSGLLLSMVDVLDSLEPRLVQKYLFSTADKFAPNVYPTKFIAAAEAYAQTAIGGGSLDLARENAISLFSKTGTGERFGKTGSVDELVSSIETAMPSIMQRITANYAEESIKLGESVVSMTDSVISTLLTEFSNPSVSIGKAFEKLMSSSSDMAAVAKSISAPQGAVQTAKVVLSSELATKGISTGDLAEAAIANRMTRAATPEEAAKIGTAQQKTRTAEAGHTAQEADVVELGDIFDISLNAGVFRANSPMLGKVVAIKDMLGRALYASYGHADMHYMVHKNRNVVQEYSRLHRHIMMNTHGIARATYGAEANSKLAEAFKILQTGAKIEDPRMVSLVESMGNSIGILFDGGNASFSVRNGLFSSHLNTVLNYFGVHSAYRFKDGVPLTKQTESWKMWDEVTDPLDVLDKVHAAYQRATVEVTIGRDISAQWGSGVKKEGFVKITDKHSRSKVFGFLDSSLYYPREIVEQLPHLDRFLDETLFRSSSDLMKMYDSVLHAYKAGLTIYRPGHHMRNLVGDMGMSFLAGVTNPNRYYDAMRILKGRASTYSGDWDAFKSLQAGEAATGAKLGSDTVLTIGRKKVKATDDAVWRGAFNQGLLNDYSIMEDIAFNESQKFGRTTKKASLRYPLGGRVQRAAGGLSQSRDHMVRIAHFVDVLKKGKFNTLEEAFEEAGKVVRKWHPDGSDLTKFERQTMRRVIPFYSWFRKAIPLVLEAMVTKPGRAMIMPKASYEFAQTMGLDPESLGDPFPQDQLYPDWMRDDILGPQWTGSLDIGPIHLGSDNGQRFGMNPGDPISDLGSGYLGGDAPKQVLGSLTPAVRIPLELGSGNALGTGAPITNTSEYLSQQLPVISVAGAIAGKDVLGGWQNKSAVEKGYQPEGLDPIALQNLLLGLGVKSFNKPNHAISAQYDLRDKLREQAGK
jgi:hypothetical protein